MRAPLSEFLMEDWLEGHRFTAKYNAGESGHQAQTLASLLSGLQPDFDFDLNRALAHVSLNDAPNMGTDELRAEVARLHPGATPENVLITTGTSEALLLLLRQLRPRRVALIVPAFQLLSEIPRSLGAEILRLPLRWSANGVPHAPIEAWAALILQSKPDVFIFNHPHNPSGLVFSDEERALLLDACDKVNCTVVGDEHYRFLSQDNRAATDVDEVARAKMGPTLWSSSQRRIVTGSFIKCAGTPGLRIGWCVGQPELLAQMQSEKNYLTHTVNPLSQKLAVWFLQSFVGQQSFFSGLYKDWLKNRSTLAEWLQESTEWVGVFPQGGLVSCLFPNTNIKTSDHFECLRERGVFLLPLSSFEETDMTGGEFSRGFRIGLGLSPNQFKELLSVMVR